MEVGLGKAWSFVKMNEFNINLDIRIEAKDPNEALHIIGALLSREDIKFWLGEAEIHDG